MSNSDAIFVPIIQGFMIFGVTCSILKFIFREYLSLIVVSSLAALLLFLIYQAIGLTGIVLVAFLICFPPLRD